MNILLARSGGYCQNPGCNIDLFPLFANKIFVDIKEAAHIISSSVRGPRANNAKRCDLESHNNILLLCPTCHTIIDKAPNTFTFEVLHKWKDCHENAIKKLFTKRIMENRFSLVKEIKRILAENKSIFELYGPTKEKEATILSDAKKLWDRNVLSVIIPNNRVVLELLEANIDMLDEDEQEGYQAFKLHKEAFEFNHLTSVKNGNTPLFPVYFFERLKGEYKNA